MGSTIDYQLTDADREILARHKGVPLETQFRRLLIAARDKGDMEMANFYARELADLLLEEFLPGVFDELDEEDQVNDEGGEALEPPR